MQRRMLSSKWSSCDQGVSSENSFEPCLLLEEDSFYLQPNNQKQNYWLRNLDQFSYEEVSEMSNFVPQEISFCPQAEEQVVSEFVHYQQEDTSKNCLKKDDEQTDNSPKTPSLTPIPQQQCKVIIKTQKKKEKKLPSKENKCHCKNSHCLKLYCECFKKGGVCGDNCECVSCENIKGNERKRQQIKDKIIEKNPAAFIEDTPYNGCGCTKNNCMMNYCDCFKMGVGCGKYCSCSECKNVYGSAKKRKTVRKRRQ